METAHSILHRVWENVPDLRRHQIADYIYGGFEFTDCQGTTHQSGEFINRFLGKNKSENAFPTIIHTELVRASMKKWRHTKGNSYPEFVTQSYFLFDTEIAGFDGRVGFAARIKDGIPAPWILDKAIQYSCDSAENAQVVYKNYAQHVKSQRFFDKMQISTTPKKLFHPEFSLYYCANQRIEKPIQTFLTNLKNLTVIDVKVMTTTHWDVQVEWNGRILDCQIDYTNELLLLNARDHNC